MNYTEAVAYLVTHERLGIKFGLQNIGRLVEALGHPEKSWRSILVAGTNGKGSTVALVESMLRAAGHRAARYTSPHLVHLEERMMAMGQPISADELADVVEEVRQVTERLRREGKILIEPTFFELTTACAFEFFRRKRVEIAVLEVGMGGRWDATNIVPADITAITNIGFDHERFLGTSLEAIAAEKAATIKQGRPVVTASADEVSLGVIRSEAEKQGSPLFEIQKEVRWRTKEVENGQQVGLETPRTVYPEMFLPLAGRHQVHNLALAVRIVELAGELGFETTTEAVAAGVAATVWEARLERIKGQPTFIIDSAHNPSASAALAGYLEDHPHPRRVLVYGVMKDKRSSAMLDLLLPHVQHLIVTRPPNPRAQDPSTVVRDATRSGVSWEVIESPERALASARLWAGKSGEVLVAGSIFLVGEVKRLLALTERS